MIALLHGGTPGHGAYAGGNHLWGSFATALGATAFETPGCGTSAPITEPMTVARLAVALGTSLEAKTSAPVHLVGHDLGGLVALMIALDAPERVAAVTVIASPAAAPSGDGAENLALKHPPAAGTQAWALERLVYSHLAIDDALVAACERAAAAQRETSERMARGEYDRHFAPSVMQAKGRLFEAGRTQGFAMPVQIIWGSHDPLVSIEHGTWLFRIISEKQPVTHFHVVNRAGNLVFRDAPRETARLVAGFRAGIGLR